MQEEISDNRLKTFFQKWLNVHREYYLPNIRQCGSALIKDMGDAPSVFVLYNDKTDKSKIYGNTSCHSAWACPKCTAEVMAKKAADIACAIDCLKKRYNQSAIMITFTIPHSASMTCKESFQVLLNTWRQFSKAGNRAAKSTQKYILKNDKGVRGKKGGALGVGKAGEVKTYYKGRDPYGAFRQELGIKHNVRVYEFTHGENAWHPHIHALFWVPDKNFKKVLAYEDELLNHWWHCVKLEAKKFWSQKITDPKELENFLSTIYADYKKTTADGHKSLYISKDKDMPDRPRRVSSSWYIAGWGGDKEVTGNFHQKATHSDRNMTPYQIIHKAFESQGEERQKYLKLYADYAQATYRHRRCEFSKSGITELIREYKKTIDYTENLKKKDTDKDKNWRMVYWLSGQQWKEILLVERTTKYYVIDDILELARAPNARILIKTFLEKFGINTDIINYANAKQVEDKINKIFDFSYIA